MHNGLFATLRNVINLYDRGGGDVRTHDNAQAADPLFRSASRISPHIRPLNLSAAEKAALEAFLRSL